MLGGAAAAQVEPVVDTDSVPWGQLISLCSCRNANLTKPEVVIGRAARNDGMFAMQWTGGRQWMLFCSYSPFVMNWVAGVPNTVVLKSGVVSGTGHGKGGEGSAKRQSACVVFHTVATCTGKHAFIRIEKGSDGKADKFTIQDNRCAHSAVQSCQWPNDPPRSLPLCVSSLSA